MNLSHWQGAPFPQRVVLEGRYTRLEPLDAQQHGTTLFEMATAPGAEDRFRYIFEVPPADRAEFDVWLEKVATAPDALFFAVIDKTTGRAEGRHALIRIEPAHGVIEMGYVLWGPAIARSQVSTEAFFLFADYVFGLGYRRFEWKCNVLNEPSKRAAARFGFTFEGIFRQHMVLKGQSRDTAWFSMLDSEWPRLKAGYEAWLRPENFDEAGQQLSKLTF
jgi:RimJ/RimL family protein N-acetyltransferase